MTTTQESGRHVTPERIRADGEALERAGFRLVYECPIGATDVERRARHAYWTGDAALNAWFKMRDNYIMDIPIPGENGRMA